MAMTTATACQNSLLIKFGSDPSLLYFVYWLPTMVHLSTVLMTFNCYSRAMYVISVALGVAAVLWHIFCIAFYIGSPEWGDIVSSFNASSVDAILWFLEIGFAIALITFQIMILMDKKGFIAITDEYIDKVECEQFKWLTAFREMEVLDHQEML